jgi:hypothetical protein
MVFNSLRQEFLIRPISSPKKASIVDTRLELMEAQVMNPDTVIIFPSFYI